jgi:hypothetical protein
MIQARIQPAESDGRGFCGDFFGLRGWCHRPIQNLIYLLVDAEQLVDAGQSILSENPAAHKKIVESADRIVPDRGKARKLSSHPVPGLP